MNLKEIQELLKQISKLELAEFKMKTEELELSVRTKHYEKGRQQVLAASAPMQMPAAPATPAAPVAPASPAEETTSALNTPAAKAAESSAKYLEVKSPIVGTFYRSPSPEKGPFLKVGDPVKAGDVVCIVEAMKLFNEIESEVSGTVVKVVVEDAQPVEYDQVLFLVDPNG
jgi:acetyl-CoA carboxylase biotin carboxyl carrier protein